MSPEAQASPKVIVASNEEQYLPVCHVSLNLAIASNCHIHRGTQHILTDLYYRALYSTISNFLPPDQ